VPRSWILHHSLDLEHQLAVALKLRPPFGPQTAVAFQLHERELAEVREQETAAICPLVRLQYLPEHRPLRRLESAQRLLAQPAAPRLRFQLLALLLWQLLAPQ